MGDSFHSLSPALKLFFPGEFRELYRKVVQTENQPILETLLAEMKISLRIDPGDAHRIPATGPVIAVANHPFGMLDGVILGALALRVRSDVKILANHLLGAIPELARHCLFVDPFDTKESKHTNSRSLKQAITHLRTGGMLIIFPAGEVSHWQFKHGEISDPEWSDVVPRLVQATRSAVLPVLFMGTNSVPFHLVGLIHPMLRTARLPRELLNKSGKEIEIRVRQSHLRRKALQHSQRRSGDRLCSLAHLPARSARRDENIVLVVEASNAGEPRSSSGGAACFRAEYSGRDGRAGEERSASLRKS